jgi:hypothetical protein
MWKFQWISHSYDIFEVLWDFHAIKPILWFVQASIVIQNDIVILSQFVRFLIISCIERRKFQLHDWIRDINLLTS